jgi:hypothetical protein
MDAAFSAFDPLEVLYGIGEVNLFPIDACVQHGLLQQTPSRSDERMSALILLVARLLSDHHYFRIRRSFAENHLGGTFVKIATATLRRSSLQNMQVRCGGHPGSCRWFLCFRHRISTHYFDE